MAERPVVSVVVPTRDRPALLAFTVRAVLAQRGCALEVVVVDDGSAEPVAATLEAAGDPRVRVVRHERSRGVSAARNAGIAAARGTWVAFCDDDDVWAPGKLALQLGAAEAGGRAWALASAVNFRDRGRVMGYSLAPAPEDVVAVAPFRNPVPGGCSNVVVTGELLARAGGFDEGLRNLADWDLWVRLARAGPPAVVDEVLVGYRVHASNMSANDAGLLEEFLRVEASTADLRTGVPASRAWLHGWQADTHAVAGRRSASVRSHLRAAVAGDRARWADALLTAVAGVGPVRARTAELVRRRLGRLQQPPAWLVAALD